MNMIHIVAGLAVAQFIVFSFLVGRARAKYGVTAPATSGHEMFDRAFRVQMNTLEQLVCFLPVYFMASVYWSPVMVCAAGVVYLVGRMIYWRSYNANPASRSIGFLLTIIPTVLLLLSVFVGAVIQPGT